MTYSSYLALTLTIAGRTNRATTTESSPAGPDVLDLGLARICALVEGLHQSPRSVWAAAQLEKDLQQATRELGRPLVQ